MLIYRARRPFANGHCHATFCPLAKEKPTCYKTGGQTSVTERATYLVAFAA